MKKILISDQVNEKSVSLLESAGFEVHYKPGIKKDDLTKCISDYNALIVRSATQVDAGLISLMNNMEVVGRAGTGVDNIDVNSASRKGILVMNTPGGNTISTAEHTMALMLSLCRNIPQANKSLLEGRWDRKKYSGTELRGKTLAIIGLGKIGREVAQRSRSFGVNVVGYDPLISKALADELGIRLMDLESIWPVADIITVHVPMGDSTKDLISKSVYEKCKLGVKIINCARGGIVNEIDTVEAIDSGKVSGAAFDVYETEPPDFSGKLINHPKIVCTPHLGASTEEAQELVAIQISEQIVEYFKENKITGAVNIKGFASSIEKSLEPYFTLSEILGMFSVQLIKGQLKKVNINFAGKNLHKYSPELTTAFQKGFLTKKVAQPVNYINAPLLFQELKISVNETKKEEHSVFKNLVSIEVVTEKETRKISGTVFGNNEIRIVEIDDYTVEVKPEKSLLVYKNIDKPGMLAAVGSALASAKINIAGLSLGRKEKGTAALTIINTDEEISETVLRQVSSISGVSQVYAVRI